MAMTPDALKTARKTLGLTRADLARTLRTPYRTYQDWESGERRIPGICALAVELLLERDRWIMRAIVEKIERDLG